MTECFEGDLAAWMESNRPSKEVVEGFVRQLVRGYLEMASRGIIHRDLKPSNILIKNQTLVIADLGHCHFLREPPSKALLGTPAYTPP